MATDHRVYILGVKDNQHPLGNTGTIITSYRRQDKLQALASNMKQMHQLDEVYLIRQYTQRMCEMDGDKFVQHIRQYGQRLA